MRVPSIERVTFALLALMVMGALIVYGYQGDQAARSVLFTLAAGAGGGFALHKSRQLSQTNTDLLIRQTLASKTEHERAVHKIPQSGEVEVSDS